MSWRVGLLLPSANAVMEGDLYRGLPHDASLHVGRMYLRDATTDSEEQMLEQFALPAVIALNTVTPDLIVFDGGGAPFIDGRDYERELGDEMSRVTGASVIGVRSAVVEALRRTQSDRIAVVTPNGEHVNGRVKAWLEREGFEVAAIHGMGCSYADSASVSPDAVFGFVQSSIGPRVRGGALLIMGTNLPAMRVLSLLEMTYDVPVVTSNLATLFQVKRRISELRERDLLPLPQLAS
jgi:maleate isomerase